MKFQESSPVLSTPDIILLTKAAAGKSGQERENEFYLLWKTWSFLCGLVDYDQNGMIRTPTKRFLKIHFEFAYYGYFSYSFGTNRQKLYSYTTVAPSKTIPDSRPNWAKSIPVTVSFYYQFDLYGAINFNQLKLQLSNGQFFLNSSSLKPASGMSPGVRST